LQPPVAGALGGGSGEGIAERQATFDTDPVSAADVQAWLRDKRQPLLVAEHDGRVVGWTRVIRSHERCAFAGVGEYTMYLDRTARGRGIGRHPLDVLVLARRRAFGGAGDGSAAAGGSLGVDALLVGDGGGQRGGGSRA
jgi:phosphinothricin acetyltransferase